jgi:hypothetical protein
MRTLEPGPNPALTRTTSLATSRGASPARLGAAEAGVAPRGYRAQETRPAGDPCAGGLTMVEADDLIGCLERYGCRALRVYGEPGKGDAVRWS